MTRCGVGPWAMPIVVFVAVILTGPPDYANGSQNVQCIQVGFNPISPKGEAVYNIEWRGYNESVDMYFTVGGKLFRNEIATAMVSSYGNNQTLSYDFNVKGVGPCNVKPIYRPPDYSSPPYPFARVDMCPPEFAIRTYLVYETDGSSTRLLNGWLHAEIEYKNGTDEMLWISVHVKDENFNAVGEFVADEKDQCANNDVKKYVTPTPYQMLPCSAIGAREVKASQGLYAVQKKYLFSKNKALHDKILGKGQDLKKGIHFTWRFSEYWCSKHERIRIDAYVLTKNNLAAKDGGAKFFSGCYRIQRKAQNYWMKPGWFGAADIRKFPHGTLNCSQPTHNDNNGKLSSSNPSWIAGTEPYTYERDIYHKDYLVKIKEAHFSQSCKVDINIPTPGPPSFGGRCAHYIIPGADTHVLHTCNQHLELDQAILDKVKFVNYSTYVNQLTHNRSELCNVKCRTPTKKDLPELKNYSRYPEGYKGYMGPSRVNLAKSNTSAARYQRGRKFHGVLCIVCTMFFMPLSIFAARFYKETFMRCQLHNIHLWYWIHIGTTIASLAMYLSAWSALLEGIGLWGRSTTTAGKCHYIGGWISNAIFTTMALIGGFRLGAGTASKLPRLAVMTLHSVLGFLNYFLNIFLVLSSTLIPESPSLEKCDDLHGMPVMELSPVGGLMLLWVLVDIVFHVALTVLQFLTDKSMSIRRRWMCPILPILPPTSRRDMKGSAVRKILFAFYVLISFILMIGAVTALALHEQPSNCMPGPSTCDTTVHPYGCTKLAMKYAKIIKTKDEKIVHTNTTNSTM